MAGMLNINTAARILNLDFGGFGHKHSGAGFVYFKDRFSHIHKINK